MKEFYMFKELTATEQRQAVEKNREALVKYWKNEFLYLKERVACDMKGLLWEDDNITYTYLKENNRIKISYHEDFIAYNTPRSFADALIKYQHNEIRGVYFGISEDFVSNLIPNYLSRFELPTPQTFALYFFNEITVELNRLADMINSDEGLIRLITKFGKSITIDHFSEDDGEDALMYLFAKNGEMYVKERDVRQGILKKTIHKDQIV